MAWNEPGGDKQDPWGGRGGEGPPDLDEVARKLRERMNSFFGNRGGSSGGAGAGGKNPLGLGLIAVLAVVAWALSGIYIVEPAEQGVVLRLGKFTTMTGPGPHWYMRGIETVDIVDVANVRNASHQARMLTQDENIIQAGIAVQYQVKDARDYLFNVRSPDTTLREVTESALREVIGAIPMDDFLSGNRSAISQQTKELTQDILDYYRTGIALTSVNLQDPQPPEEVQGAFEDAIKAREDQERFKNKAEAYALDIVPKARGDATRMREQAMAYREQIVAKADGETSRFLQTLEEYEKAPEITRKRLYLDTMEYVLANSSKVVLQVKDGNNLMYIPLDRMMGGSRSTPENDATRIGTDPASDIADMPRLRESGRERRSR